MSRSRRRSALRLAARAAVFALIGAAATVAVAWGFKQVTTHNPHYLASHFPTNPPDASWPAPVPTTWPAKGRLVFAASNAGVTYEEWDQVEYMVGVWTTEVLQVGWPLKSLQAYEIAWSEGPTMRTKVVGMMQSGQRKGIGVIGFLYHGLPCLPLWPGFLVNTVFYGGLAFLVWGAPGLVRWRVRRRRGRCAACGYDLSGAGGALGGVCPECGGVQRTKTAVTGP